MVDKCRVKMVERELYNMRDPPWEREGRKERKNTIAIEIAFITGLIDLYEIFRPGLVIEL